MARKFPELRELPQRPIRAREIPDGESPCSPAPVLFPANHPSPPRSSTNIQCHFLLPACARHRVGEQFFSQCLSESKSPRKVQPTAHSPEFSFHRANTVSNPAT